MQDIDDEAEIGGSPYMEIMTHRRRPGRPRAAKEGSTVSVWVSTTLHDRLIKIANQNGQSVSGLVRSLLLLKIREE